MFINCKCSQVSTTTYKNNQLCIKTKTFPNKKPSKFGSTASNFFAIPKNEKSTELRSILKLSLKIEEIDQKIKIKPQFDFNQLKYEIKHNI